MKILFIAPISSLGGHALISKILFYKLINKYQTIPIDLSLSSSHYGNFSWSRLIKVLEIIKIIFNNKKDSNSIYITISQSLLGNLKDLFIFIILFNKLDKLTIHLHGGSIGVNLFSKRIILKKINFFFYRKIKNIIISGKSHNYIFPNYLQNKIKIIENFAPIDMFNSYKIIVKKFSNPEKIRILFLSNMLPEKGYLQLLEGFKLLKENLKNEITLDFAGKFYDTDLKTKFLNLIKEEANVSYHGAVSERYKKKLFHRSHIFCLPTIFLEGQPISIIEAYASGCFVLTSDKPGINDIFTNGVNGISIKTINPLSIANALKKIIKDIKNCKEVSLNNRKLAGKRFREQKYFRSIEDLLI